MEDEENILAQTFICVGKTLFTVFNYSFDTKCRLSQCDATKARIILVSMYSVGTRNAIDGNSKILSIYVNL